MTATRIWTEFRAAVAGFFARRGVPSSDVDDLVQEVFLRIHRGLEGLKDEQRVAGWVFAIASNVLRDRLRKKPDPERRAVSADEPIDDAMRACVVSMVDSLDEPYRSALHAVELDGESQADAARRLGLSHAGMKSRVQRGRTKLRELFDACCTVEWDTHGRPGCACGDG